MANRFSEWLHKISSGWLTLASLLIFLSFTALVLPGQATRGQEETGGSGSPDTSFYYSADDLYQMAEEYGQEGREAYVRIRFTFDLVWPLVYTLFLVTSISWLSRRAFSGDSPWQLANLAPILAALFDLLENISTSLVMVRYPDHTAVIDTLAPIFTAVKWILVGISFLLLLASLFMAAWRWRLATRSKPAP